MLDIKNKISGIFSKKQQTPSSENQEVFPLGIRIGSVVSIDATLFTLCQEDSYVEYPGKDFKVNHFGKYTLGGICFYRFYLETSKESNYLLEVAETESTKKIESITLYQLIDQVFPESEEEWDDWLGDEGHLGGYNFESPDEVQYRRVYGSTSNKIDPVEVIETVNTEKNTTTVNHLFMTYQRNMDLGQNLGFNELLWVSASEEDGGDSAYIDIWAGLELKSSDLDIY